ncbi:MAG: type I glyceraldehyde-3-phosphate dehydrogenase [Fimbriimonadia bacterium]|jgi:glyceraldehyde 3-phosphate dehydrogenase
MATKIGINGFGRIGRLSLRAILEKYPGDLEVVAVNDLYDPITNTHLFKWDSNYGRFKGDVEPTEKGLKVNGREIRVYAEKDPANIPWADHGVQIVIEGTGVFRDKEKVAAHLRGTVKKALITAPAKNEDITVVMGVNEQDYDPANHHVVSNASCTTNCLAPFAKVIQDGWGIEKGLMVTIHAYTNDQRVADQAHKDLRRARAAAESIIPTSTGAAKAIGLVMPELKGKMHGYALRVPTATVSCVDLTVQLSKEATAEQLNAAFEEAAKGRMKGILDVTYEPLVSKDFVGNSFSSIVDAPLTMVLDGTMAKVVSWYDNEWGYSCRVADFCKYMAEKGL